MDGGGTAQRDDQDPGHDGRPSGHHPLHRGRDQRERHPALLDRALRGGDRGLARRHGAAPGAGRVAGDGGLGGELLREPGGRQGGPPAGPRSPLRGRIAIANAAAAYRLFEWSLGTPRWDRLAKAGARPQRPLWASTSTKDPRYPDIYYVEALVAPRTVNTLPPETFAAYRDHGRPAVRIRESIAAPPPTCRGWPSAGIDLATITRELEEDGVAKFAASYRSLLAGIEAKAGELATLSRPCWRALRRLSLTHWIFIGMVAGILVGWLDHRMPDRDFTRAEAALHHLPPDDQVDRGPAHLRDPGRRHRGAWRRSEAHRPARAQVARLLLGS